MASAADFAVDEEISQLREQNERLKDDLLTALQQPQDQATDGSIKEEYSELCQSIDFWVDNVIEDSNLDKHSRKLSSRERTLLREVAVYGFTPRDENASTYLLLSVAVQRELQRKIFDRPYPVGITKQQEAVIEQVLEGMQTLESGKAQVIRDRWRSETVRALTAHKDFERSRDSSLTGIVEAATDFISPRSDKPICGLDHRAFRKHRDTFYNDIFLAAVNLHKSMRSSIHQYNVERPEIDVSMTGDGMWVGMGWRLKDVDRWQDVKRTDSSARPIYSLYPSIVRELEGPRDTQIIVPPTVVVELQSSKGSGQSSRIQSSRPSPARSLTSETTNKETVRHHDKRRDLHYAHADSDRARNLSRSMELPNPPNSQKGNRVWSSITGYLGMQPGRSETFPTAKQKAPGKRESARESTRESARFPGNTREQRVIDQRVIEYEHQSNDSRSPDRVTVFEERTDIDNHRLSQDPTSFERYRQEQRDSQHYSDSPRRRRTSEGRLERVYSA